MSFAPVRVSPLHTAYGAIQGALDSTDNLLALADLSLRPRFGAKGPQAAQWLAAHGVAPPPQPNSWLPLAGGFVARLGLSEFLVEGVAASALAADMPPAGVYPVPREDAAIGLAGPKLNELLLQTCNVNFRALDLAMRPMVLTSLAGVTVTALPEGNDGCRIYCDYTFGDYLWRTLLEIAGELGGGATDAARFPDQPHHP